MGWADQVGVAFERAQGAIGGVQAPLSDMGMKLWAGLALIAFIWHAIRWILEAGDITAIAGGLVRTVFFLGLGYWLMPTASAPSPIIGFVVSLTQDVTKLVAGQAGLPGVVESVEVAVATYQSSVQEMMSFIWRQQGFTGILSQLPSLFLLALAQFILAGAAAMIFLVGLAGVIMVQAATILSPLFIPWLVLPVTSWIFDGWLKWFVSASLYQVLGSVFLQIGLAALKTAVPPIPGPDPSQWGIAMGAAMVIMMIAYTIYWLAGQVPALASGLLSGGASLAGTPNPGGAAARASGQAAGAGIKATLKKS